MTISWENFATTNIDARGLKFKFEDLCRQLFINECLAFNDENKYLHSNPNNPGIECEPIFDERNNRWIGFQAKYFESKASYKDIKSSAEEIVKPYKGRLDCVFLYCNKPLTKNL